MFICTYRENDHDPLTGELIKATEGLHSYKVDMTLRSGLGDITEGPINLSGVESENWTEKITSVKGSECNTFWVISLYKNKYVSFKIDTSGLHTTPVTSTVYYTSEDPRGYLKVSPSGEKIASATYGSGKLHLYSFDDTTGIVANDAVSLISNPDVDGYAYGIEFSPNSSKLYTSTRLPATDINKLFQFDLSQTNISASKTLINSQTGYRGALQLAPNGKIYTTVPADYDLGIRYLNAINLPDEDPENCDFEPQALYLGYGVAMQGLPPFIASLLLPIEITDGATNQNLNNTTAKRCIGENYQLTAQNLEGNPNYTWTFNNIIIGTSETLNFSNLSSTDQGTYYFEAETIDDCGFTITYKGTVELEVYQPPTIAKPSDLVICDDDNDGFSEFDFSTSNLEVLNGQDATLFEVLYFENQMDADNNENALALPYTNSGSFTEETLFVRIHNIHNPICYETESFTLQVFEAPTPPATITNLSICDSNDTGTDSDGFEVFDLTIQESDILNGQSATDFTITYFEDAALTLPITNVNNYKNTLQDSQPIYYQVTNNYNAVCSASASFNLEVFSLPTINDNFTFKQCDEDGNPDGFTDFNLTEANDYLTLGDNSLTVTYYLDALEAENASNTVNPSPFSNNTAAVVYARIENTNGCFRVA